MNLSDVKAKSTRELADRAAELGIEDASGLRRQDLIFALLRAEGQKPGTTIIAEGVLEVLPDGFGFLRAPDANYMPGADDIYVSPSQIRRFNLHTGDTVAGQIRAPKETERYFALLRVESINHIAPDARQSKVSFDDLTAVYPDQRLTLAHDDDLATRIIDQFCPIGRGQRAIIATPPRAPNLLGAIARGITANHDDVDLVVLLIEERPEEVTEMRRATSGEVVSSTFDEPATRHVQVAEIVIEKARRLAEAGRDVVILVDSITRLARALHAVTPPSGRLLPGGVDPAAMQLAKRFFGTARNLSEGGSLTIIATAASDTGSTLDDEILEELTSGANCEIRLDPELVGDRHYPFIDVRRSATRQEERLLAADALEKIRTLRSGKLSGESAARALDLAAAEV